MPKYIPDRATAANWQRHLVLTGVLWFSLLSALAQQGSMPMSLGNYPQLGSQAGLQRLVSSRQQATLVHFYARREYRLAWFGRWGLRSPADSLLLLIGQSTDQGLLPAHYHQERLQTLFALISQHQATALQVEEADYLLSDAFFTLALHLQKGRFVPHTGVPARQLLPADEPLAALLEIGLHENNLRQQLLELEPQHAQYRLLKAALEQRLKRYRKLQQPGPRPPAAEVLALEQEMRLLAVNLERWRWEARSFPYTYLLVNLPAYKLQVLEGDMPVFSSRVTLANPPPPARCWKAASIAFSSIPTGRCPVALPVRGNARPG
ncbi:L,D-transpeptidase scaffold domain-containing protein [Cesiribacter andamanensis]|uniref:L,D-transpeptidase scaffold domain-containing protein n=1 Tax=Cesiribacter andamanensis AMV16 TaxID=1279009 RepID=M7NFW5_9BACT|nr:hypothetical protein [Cesiribacter andamanensis]EMR00705.1 hypothetical protein ADICEAN_04177 [Cesiribacter andamanensis AMV16]